MSGPAASGAVTRVLKIVNEKGLHARASAKFVAVVEKFKDSAAIKVSRGEETVSGDSIMGLMMLGAGIGSSITVSATGAQAKEARRGARRAGVEPVRRGRVTRPRPASGSGERKQMPPPLLTLQDIHLTFGGTPLLEGAELAIGERERVCLVGRNGSGKSTLLKIAAGTVESDRGARFAQPGATIRYLAQEPDLSGFATTLAYVEAGLAPGDDTHRARYLLEQLGLAGDEDPARLSGGEARRAALARVLAPEPDILLLDEPTNHLDLPAIEWLEDELAASRSALVLISHDRRFLQKLSRATVWLDRGVTRRIEKGFASFEEWRDQVLEEEEREQHKLGRKIVAEEHWIRYGGLGTAQAQCPSRRLAAGAAQGFPRASRRARHGEDFRQRCGAFGQAGGRSRPHLEILRRDADRARLLHSHPARRPHRPRRPERRGQDDAPEDAHGRARAGRRPGDARRELADGDTRPAARRARSGYLRARHAHRRARRQRVRRRTDAPRRRLHAGLPVRTRAGRHCGIGAVRRRARPADARAARSPSHRTCWCSTSRPTISISKRSTCWKR